MPPTPERADVEFPREARKTSSNPTVQGSSAWVQKVASEIGHIDMSMVPPPNVVALDPDVLKRDCQRLAHRLDRMEAWLLNPRTKWMQYWDFVILGAMFFTATITPYEVCFIWESTGLDALFFVNIVINLIFIIDTTFQFFLPYKESIRKGGGIIKNHKKIARHYLTTWFPIDFVSIIPFDYIINFAIMPAVGAESDNTSLIGATSMLRLLRLIKLVRILRASRIFARWENSISMKYSTRELISILCAVVLTLHWLSCMLGMSAQLMRSERTFDLRAAVLERVWENENLTQSSLEEPLCFGCPAPENDAMFAQPNHPAFGMDVWCESVCYTDCELDALARLQLPMAFDSQVTDRVTYLQSQESWVCRNIKRGHIRQMPAYHGEVYVAGLVVAMLQMSGGVGSIMPTNLPEYIIFMFGIAIGSVMWALVVGTICGISATGNPFNMAFKHNMDQLNYFLEDMQMPIELRHRSREFLRNARDLGKKHSYNEVVERLSPEVKKDCVLTMSLKTLQCVWYFNNNDLEDGALVELSMRLERYGFAPRERLSTDRLNILMRGVAARAGKIMTNQGNVEDMPHWGHDIILRSNALRDRRPAAALTYVEVITLTKKDLDEVCELFPLSGKKVREAKVYLAVRRSMVVVADYIRDHAGDEFAAGAAPRRGRISEVSAFSTKKAGENADPLGMRSGMRLGNGQGGLNANAAEMLLNMVRQQSRDILELKEGMSKMAEVGSGKGGGTNSLAA